MRSSLVRIDRNHPLTSRKFDPKKPKNTSGNVFEQTLLKMDEVEVT